MTVWVSVFGELVSKTSEYAVEYEYEYEYEYEVEVEVEVALLLVHPATTV